MKEWNKLSPEDQALFQAEAKEMDIWARDYVKKEIEDDLNTLRKNAKVVMELKPEERKRIIEVAKPVMADLSKKNLGEYYDELWGILDKTR
jgi:TRAP-type C4-dicarboxylate transport system substrate-binding protein